MSIFKNPRPGEAAGAILIVIGLTFVLISAAVIIVKDKGEDKLSGTTKGILINDSRSKKNKHQPTYKYEAEGASYECRSTASSSFEPEQEAMIRYNPSKPDECSSSYDEKITKILIPIFLGVGIFLNGIGIASILVASRKK